MNHKQINNASKMPIGLQVLNFVILFPIIVWPLLFMNADDMLDSSIDYVWLIFIGMFFYPHVLIGNIFFSKKLFTMGYPKTAITISITLGICGVAFIYAIFFS